MPAITLSVADHAWTAIIDTGFNGDLELPLSLRPFLDARLIGRIRSLLAGEQYIEEDQYLVDWDFDGASVTAEATFSSGAEILIGTHLLRHHRLEINFVSGGVLLERIV